MFAVGCWLSDNMALWSLGGPGPLVESLQRPQSDPRKIPDQATDLRFSAYNSTLLGSGNSESQDTRLGGS